MGEAGIPGTDPANNYSNNYSNLSAEFGLKILRRIEALRNGLREAGQLRPELSRVATIADDIKASGAHLRSEIQDIQALLDEKLDRVRTLIDQRLDEVVALEARLRNLELRVAGKALPTVRQPGFQEAVAEMRRYCERHGMPPRPFVLAGYPKCGNTLTRLVYHNLIAVANTGATETMTYTRLNHVNPNHSFPGKLALEGFREPAEFDHAGFPLMLHSHNSWEPFWDEIGDLLFIERHPLDSLIGYWYTLVRFPEQPRERIGLDDFVLRELPDWIERYRGNRARAKATLRYEDVMADPDRAFATAFRALGISFQADHLSRAVAMSAFDNVRAMEDSFAEHHGHATDPAFRVVYDNDAWKSDPRIRFTRSGKTGQWRTELQATTLTRAAQLLRENGMPSFADALGA